MWCLCNKPPHMAAHQVSSCTTIILILRPEINVSFLYQPAITSQGEGVYKDHTLFQSIMESSGTHHQMPVSVCVFVLPLRCVQTY